MLAARMHAFGEVPILEQVAVPAPSVGESLVRIEAAAVAHIDLTVATGTFAFQPSLPYVPGTDGAGRIVASSRYPEGATVRVRGGGVGLSRDGCWAEFVAVPDEALDVVPDASDPALVATFVSPCVTAEIAVAEVGRLQVGERVAVVGAAGAVGAVATQLALAGGASEVVGIEASAERIAGIPSGAVRMTSLDGLEPVDLLIDMAGGEGLAARVAAVRPGGRLVLVGYAGGVTATLDLPAFLARDVRLLPVNLILWEPRMRERARELLEALQDGTLVLPITRFPLDAAVEAIAALRGGALPGRIALVPTTMEREQE